MSSKIIITVNEGKIRGFKNKSFFSGVEYYSFLGVPYGQSTEGRARFKDPVKVKPWHGLLDATEEKAGCIQFSQRKQEINGSEDCLYNNIHIPEMPKEHTPLKAVIVNVHPGALFNGSPDPHYYGSPEFLMHRDFVYVCIGFRLHILGFLNLEMGECSGNQGIKDIILGLRWIADNIKSFGGDPENITILGSSSGSLLVQCLLLSPQAKGLYHKAVLMGGYVFNPLPVIPVDNVSVAYKLATNMGYEGKTGDNKKLLQFYKKLSTETIILQRMEGIFNHQSISVFPISPFSVTQDIHTFGSPVLPLPLRDFIPLTTRVPIMIGFCEKEAVFGLIKQKKQMLRTFFYKAVQQNQYGWGKDLTEEELKTIQKEIDSFYFNGDSMETAKLSKICDVLTDILLSDVYDTLIDVISSDLPLSVYVYKFQYDGNLCTMKAKSTRLLEETIEGTFHAADYSYWSYNEDLLRSTPGSKRIQTEDRNTVENLTNLITTFAKTGDPNYEGIKVKWQPTNPSNPCYLSINETLELKNGQLNAEGMEFWQGIKKKFQKHSTNK